MLHPVAAAIGLFSLALLSGDRGPAPSFAECPQGIGGALGAAWPRRAPPGRDDIGLIKAAKRRVGNCCPPTSVTFAPKGVDCTDIADRLVNLIISPDHLTKCDARAGLGDMVRLGVGGVSM